MPGSLRLPVRDIMARPRNTPIRIALRKARKTLASIQKIDARIAPKWHEKMIEHWTREVDRLAAEDRAERSAH